MTLDLHFRLFWGACYFAHKLKNSYFDLQILWSLNKLTVKDDFFVSRSKIY